MGHCSPKNPWLIISIESNWGISPVRITPNPYRFQRMTGGIKSMQVGAGEEVPRVECHPKNYHRNVGCRKVWISPNICLIIIFPSNIPSQSTWLFEVAYPIRTSWILTGLSNMVRSPRKLLEFVKKNEKNILPSKKENLIVYHINIVIRPWRLDKLVIDHQLDFFMILIWGILIIPHFIVDDFKQCQRQEGPGSGRFLALRRIRRCLRDGRELSHQNGLDFLSHSTANNGIMDVKLICILIDTSGFNIN